MRILLLDCTLDASSQGSASLRKLLTLSSKVTLETRRAPDGDIPHDLTPYQALVVSGSRASCVTLEKWSEKIFDCFGAFMKNERPILGVCFGMQLLARYLDGESVVRRSKVPEFGWARVEITNTSALTEELSREKVTFFVAHEEEVVKSELRSFKILGHSEHCAVQWIQSKSGPYSGVQFHPERMLHEGSDLIDGYMRNQKHGLLTTPAPTVNLLQKHQEYFIENFLSSVVGRK